MTSPQPPSDPIVNTSFLLKALLGSALLGGAAGLGNTVLKQRKAILEADEDPDDGFAIPTPMAPKRAALGIVGDALGVIGDGVNAAGQKFNDVAKDWKFVGQQPQAQGADNIGIPDLLLGGAAIPLGFLGGIHGARMLEQQWKRRDLKQQLNDSRQAYEEALQQEQQTAKRASTGGAAAPPSRPLNAVDATGLAFMGVPLLTALTAGILSDRYLSAQFPPLSKAIASEKRFRLSPGMQPEEEDEMRIKAAADMLLVECALQTHKSSSDTGLRDLIGAVAQGRIDELEQIGHSQGVAAALDASTGGWHKAASYTLTCKHAAVVEALDSPVLGDTVRLLAATEFAHASPTWRERGAAYGEHPKMASQLESLTGAVSLMAVIADFQREFPAVKSASADPAVVGQVLRSMLAGGGLQQNDQTDDNAGDQASTLITSSLETQHSNPDQRGASNIENRNPKDEIDSLLDKQPT